MERGASVALIVDDDAEMCSLAGDALRADGFGVIGCASAAEALAQAERVVPDVILSDIVMPRVGGFAFRRMYAARFPERATPFVFLSSLADAETLAAGLDAGADDYVVKPFDPAVLRARVRAVLRRGRARDAVVRGTLGAFPLLGLLQFCEERALTGELTVQAGAREVRFGFRDGQIQGGAPGDVDAITDAPEATFTLRAKNAAEGGGAPAPAGLLTEERVGRGLFHVQTQLQGDELVTVVMSGERTFMKKATPIGGRTRGEIEPLVASQHADVLAVLRDRVASARMTRDSVPPVAAGANVLVDEGYERYLAKDYAGAVAQWERALALDPASKTLALNIAVLRRKIGQGGAHGS